MCKWGTYEKVECIIVGRLSHTGKDYKKLVKIDKCIAHIVDALSKAGIRMVSSCCGHGEKNGWIVLEDGVMLSIERIKNFGTYDFKRR